MAEFFKVAPDFVIGEGFVGFSQADKVRRDFLDGLVDGQLDFVGMARRDGEVVSN